jgi:glycosyltransferase involved in cell wall biosynthesis
MESPHLFSLFAVRDARCLDHPDLLPYPNIRARYRKLPSPGEPFVVALRAAVAEVAGLPEQLPAPAPPAPRAQPARIHLFLPVPYKGGVWEATRSLVVGLSEVNSRRREAEFSLAVVPDQTGLEELARVAPDVRLELLTHQEYAGAGLPWSPSALEADCWFALVDRFFLPTPPLRPLGVLVYDVIQRFLPETFFRDFHEVWAPAARATLSRASLVITTNRVTQRHAAEEYGLPAEKMALVPTACEPGMRFTGLVPEPAAVEARDGFLLTLTNLSPHKGLSVTLKAYAALKAKLGDRAPGLVVSGITTERASPDYKSPDGPHPMQALARQLGLVPGRDLWCLGFTNDAQLLGLLQRCGAVVNSADFDNGSFSLIEADYFGKPALCSRYDAAVALYERFGVPVEYYPVGDHLALAELMRGTVGRPALSAEQLVRRREELSDYRLGHRHFAEQFYDLLLGLARGASIPRQAEAA